MWNRISIPCGRDHLKFCIEARQQRTEAKQMIPTPNKTIRIPILNPRIDSGASLGYSTLKDLSFGLALWMNGG